MHKRFSERYGFTKPRESLQYKSMDDALRNRLFNTACSICEDYSERSDADGVYLLLHSLHHDLLKSVAPRKSDFLSRDSIVYILAIRAKTEELFNNSINYVYDYIEWLIEYIYSYDLSNPNCEEDVAIYIRDVAISSINDILEEEMSAYRIVNGLVVPITNENEIEEIETAIDKGNNVGRHLSRALALYADRKEPGYRNSINESLRAVEALCCKLINNDNATLGKSLDILEGIKELNIFHPALLKAFDSLYGFSGDTVRHAIKDKSVSIDQEDARFMLVSCSAFVNYLSEKARKAGIPL